MIWKPNRTLHSSYYCEVWPEAVITQAVLVRCWHGGQSVGEQVGGVARTNKVWSSYSSISSYGSLSANCTQQFQRKQFGNQQKLARLGAVCLKTLSISGIVVKHQGDIRSPDSDHWCDRVKSDKIRDQSKLSIGLQAVNRSVRSQWRDLGLSVLFIVSRQGDISDVVEVTLRAKSTARLMISEP